jgi:hypothetical protein
MSINQLYKIVIKQMNKYRKHCLWRGQISMQRNHPKLLGKWCAYRRREDYES